MPDAIITSTESTFGTISGTFLETGATIQGTITGVVAGTLDGSVGVPGPAGAPGATGPQGPQGIQGVPGTPGVGVPAGGTAGQILAKVDGTNYNTQWVNDSGAVVWGDITGTLSNQTDLQTALNAKLDIDDAESSFYPLTGNPSGFLTSSALSGYATESWVTAGFYPLASNPAGYLTSASLSAYAPLASPAFTGNPTAPTAPLADNDTSIATTAFVQQELASGTAVAKNLEVYVRNQTGATLTAGTIVYINGATGNRPTITKAQANNDANSAQTFGFVKASIANNGFGYVIVRGELENVDTSALTEGVQLYLSPTVAGTWTTTKPSAPQHLVYVGICVRAHPTQGTILVAVQNGYELDELHDVQIVSPTNGQVLKYDSATGLWKNGTDSAGVAWGGITGTLSSQTDLQTALDGKYSTSNPAGYITSAPVTSVAGKTGAVSLVVADVSGAAPTASPALSGTPTAPTAANGTNTTQIATTAFVLANAAAPAFATMAEALQGDITDKVMSPRRVRDMLIFPGYVDLLGSGSTNTAGTGASVTIYGAGGRVHEIAGPNIAVAGYAQYTLDTTTIGFGLLGFARGARGDEKNWAKKIGFSGRGHFGYMGNNTFNGDANSTIRVSLGGKFGGATGDISVNEPGFGFKFVPGGELQMVVSRGNGTALTITNTGFTPVLKQTFDWKFESDGAGNIACFINDVQVATATNGPTQTEAYNAYFEQVESTASTTIRCLFEMFNAKLYWSA